MNHTAEAAQNDAEFREIITSRARSKRDHVLTLVRERRRLETEIDRERRYLDDLNRLLRDEGLETVEIPAAVEKPTVVSTHGRRNGNAPARRAPYDTMLLAEAVDSLLSHGRDMHADEIVREIFEAEDPKDFRSAKQNLGSTLSRLAKAGRWDKVAPNRYRAKDTTEMS
jgi:hypothetical protein